MCVQLVLSPLACVTTVNLMDAHDQADQAQALLDEGSRLIEQYIASGVAEDLAEALNAFDSAVEMPSEDAATKAARLNGLGAALQVAFIAFNDVQWLDQAIDTVSQAVNLDENAASLSALGNLWMMHFESEATEDYAERMSELEDAVEFCCRAVERSQDNGDEDEDEDLPHYLNNYGLALQTRYEAKGYPEGREDLQKAIDVHRRAVHLAPNDAAYCCHLADVLRFRFQCLDTVEDLAEAITLSQRALDVTSDELPVKSIFLSSHALTLRERYERTGVVNDLEGAIAHSERAVELTSDSYFDKPRWLTNLGLALRCRFELYGTMSDLGRAVSVSRSAVEMATKVPGVGVELTAICQNNLSLALYSRYERLTELDDLEDAVVAAEQAMELTPDGHPQKAGRITNLSTTLRERFLRTKDWDDIDGAILEGRRAVECCPDTHPDAAIYHDNLALSLRIRYDNSKNGEDLDAAVASHERVVSGTPVGHQEYANRLCNFGMALKAVYERSREVAQLDAAIDALQQAVDSVPDGHARKAVFLNDLGVLCSMHYVHSEDDSESRMYHERGVSVFELAATEHSGAPSTRLNSAIGWAGLKSQLPYGNAASALPAYAYVLDLLPRVAWLGQEIRHRLYALSDLGTYAAPANAAAATAIEAGSFALALEWIEQGRSLLWAQTLALRAPVDVLRDSSHADLADEFERTAKALEHAGNPSQRIINDSTRVMDKAAASAQHHALAARYEELLTQIRNIHGFHGFLQPKKFDELRLAAQYGPIIIVNAHATRCDALALCPSGEIIHIALSHFSEQLGWTVQRTLRQAMGRESSGRASALVTHEDATMGGVLRVLWLNVVLPILQALETELFKLANDCIPRVTWCGTGPFSALPLHAAGIYNGNLTERVAASDFVVSSYSPNIFTLLGARNSATTVPQKLPLPLVVAQAKTPGLSPLPGTVQELRIIRERFAPASPTVLFDADATVSGVLSALQQHPCVHLACHGVQHTDPLRSSFALHDGSLELAEIIRTPLPHARLAFLSACQTATGDAALPEESVHLVAVMLAAGFPSVVGTLWAIGDEDAPEVADGFYAALLAGRDVSHALHESVQALKARIGVEEYTRWVPFVHFGS